MLCLGNIDVHPRLKPELGAKDSTSYCAMTAIMTNHETLIPYEKMEKICKKSKSFACQPNELTRAGVGAAATTALIGISYVF